MLLWLGHRRQIQDWETEVNWMSQIARRRGGVAKITSCAFAMVVNKLWTARNYIRFKKRPFSSEQIIKDIVLHIHIRGRNNSTWRECLQMLPRYPF
uniref:Putative ovule protein n=1 Tax=Solanum chacoense TaxID=4108 RepID=A0A0V0GXM3_SOLCH